MILKVCIDSKVQVGTHFCKENVSREFSWKWQILQKIILQKVVYLTLCNAIDNRNIPPVTQSYHSELLQLNCIYEIENVIAPFNENKAISWEF